MCLKIIVTLGLSVLGALGKQVSCLSPIVDTSAVDAGECLLASGSMLSRALSKSSSSLGVTASVHRAWRIEHQKLQKVANDTLDIFIRAQNSSKDACSARLMESKRTLDGLLKDLKAIEEQVDSHEELLQTETENLNITHKAIEAAESSYEDDKQKCADERKQAQDDLAMYNAELEELKQIAEPSVRYEHSVKVTLPEKGKNFNAAENVTALLQQGAFSLSSCQAFKTYSLHSKVLQFERAKNLTCDEQREELQKVFTETYIEILGLIKDAEDRGEDETCFESAEAERTSALVPLTSQREQASARIEYSTQALAMLQPILNLLKARVDKLEKHITETLTPECADATKVSETLKAVRDLIISLEKCPGRNDFRLQIPEEEETGKATAPAETTSALQEGAAKPHTAVASSVLQKLATNKSQALQHNNASSRVVGVKPDAHVSQQQLKTAKPHRHRHHKHGHEHAHTEVQGKGEVHQIDDDHEHEVSETAKKDGEDSAKSGDKQDKKKDDGSISITVESTSV
eukprot:gnl/MRDRNA2_/MRDRNA2_79022_c0_seq3.p1 gnl/MRDRNA2_/MRDRNA2_79022_c0~~gnl/MRDRNA2_/MRDRNA2_79022_c0_seq3.p1  ORF type:complete len:519 (-),score=122.88 gnl/MRDRNA2_/MRDRNA2_79022_c0_seq3:29-1585(-)